MTETVGGVIHPSSIGTILVVAPENTVAIQMIYELPFHGLSGLEFSWRSVKESALTSRHLEGITVMILYRCSTGNTLGMARLARKKQIKIIYELDDDLLDPPSNEAWGRYYLQQRLPQVLRLFLAEADLVKAGSRELALRLTQLGFPTIYLPYAAKLRHARPRQSKSLVVGYFGTPHHQADINAVFPALMEIEQIDPAGVEFEFIGCAPEQWPKLKTVKVLPFITDYQQFLDELAQRGWTLGLAPLVENRFNTAKSDSKFRDYSAAGIAGVYADTVPYREAVQHGINGWLCGSTVAQWVNQIRLALDDPGRESKIKAARRQLLSANLPKTVARDWLTLLIELLNTR